MYVEDAVVMLSACRSIQNLWIHDIVVGDGQLFSVIEDLPLTHLYCSISNFFVVLEPALRHLDVMTNNPDEPELAKDQRVVAMVYRSESKDWTTGAHTGIDYWSRDEDFIVKRRSGEIDDTEMYPFWRIPSGNLSSEISVLDRHRRKLINSKGQLTQIRYEMDSDFPAFVRVEGSQLLVYVHVR
ncbi:hypothetical protein B0H19DRAFT_1063302 [Mycena capillaripes]|nr:hypothetical protein B0H19DRAFT_1063302 [Mycena capillaripes]